MSDILKSFNETVKPRDLLEGIHEYWYAVGDSDNPDMFSLGYQWADKPHRLIYDLCAKVRFDANHIEQLNQEVSDKCDSINAWRAKAMALEEENARLKEAEPVP